jgi:hypothetical protein
MRHTSARVAPEGITLEQFGAHGSRSLSTFAHPHPVYPNAIVVALSAVQHQVVDGGASTPSSKKVALSLALEVNDHVFVSSAAATDASGHMVGGKIDADGTITCGPLPLGVKLSFSGTEWSVEPKKLLMLLCVLGSIDGVEALSKLSDGEGVDLLRKEIVKLDPAYLTIPIDAWCVQHFALSEGDEPVTNTMVRMKLERWRAAGWTLAHTLVQQVMCGSSDVIEDYGAEYGKRRLTAQWNWCTGETHTESGSAIAECVLAKLAQNAEAFVCPAKRPASASQTYSGDLPGENGDTPLHVLCRTFTNRVIEERYVIHDGVPVRRVFAVGSDVTSASAHVPHSGRFSVDTRESRTNIANQLMEDSEAALLAAEKRRTSFAAGAGVPAVRTGRIVDLPALDKPRIYSQGAADLPLATWLDAICSGAVAARRSEASGPGFAVEVQESILSISNDAGESPIQALMRNNGLQEGWIEKSYELCPAAWTEVYTGTAGKDKEAGKDSTLLHLVMAQTPNELEVLTVPLVMEAIKVLPVSLLAKETVDKLTPVHYLMDNEELSQKVLNDARVDLYPLFAVALQHRGKMQTIIDTYKEKEIESLVFEQEAEDVENHSFAPALHARDVVALLTGYSPGHKLWSFAFDYLLQPQLLQARENFADGKMAEEDGRHYSHYRAWPADGNTFPSGSCEVRGDTVGSDDVAQNGVRKSHLVEWEYWMRQMLTCKNPKVRVVRTRDLCLFVLFAFHSVAFVRCSSAAMLPIAAIAVSAHAPLSLPYLSLFPSISGAAHPTSSHPRSSSSHSPASSMTMPDASSFRTSLRVAIQRSTPFLPRRLSTPASFAGGRSACGTTISGCSRSASSLCATRSPPPLDLSRSTTQHRGFKRRARTLRLPARLCSVSLRSSSSLRL